MNIKYLVGRYEFKNKIGVLVLIILLNNLMILN